MHRSGKSAADLESLRQRLREDSPASTWPRGGSTFPQMVARRSCGRRPRPRSAGKSLRGPSMICGHRARVATGAARRRGRARSSAAPRRVHGSTNSTRAAQRRRRGEFLPQLSGRPVFGERRRRCTSMTSMRTTRRDDVKQLSQQLVPALLNRHACVLQRLHDVGICRTAAKRQMRAPAANLRLGVSTPDFFDGFLAFPHASSEDGFIRPKTSPLQH